MNAVLKNKKITFVNILKKKSLHVYFFLNEFFYFKLSFFPFFSSYYLKYLETFTIKIFFLKKSLRIIC